MARRSGMTHTRQGVLPVAAMSPATRFRLALSVTLSGLVAASAIYGRARYFPPGEVLPGLRVDGTEVVGDVAAVIEARASALLARKIAVVPSDDRKRPLTTTTFAELGVDVDRERMRALALALGHEGDVLGRMEQADRARRGELDVPLLVRVDDKRAAALLAPLKLAEDTAAIPARLDLERRAVVPDKSGRAVDVAAAIAAIEPLARSSEATLVLPVHRYAPRISSEFLRGLDISTVLASFETGFSRGGDQGPRARNIEVGAAKLDGLVMPPGELVSFNQIVGERSEENGFQKAYEIFKGEMVPGIGGGTCQVASTLHAAVFFAGVDVLERLPHSRPSAYIPMGLDSTVVYPSVDMKLRNPFPFPVVVHAKVDGNKLRIEVLGKEKPASVTFSRAVVQTYPYTRKVIEEPGLSGQKVIVKQHGIRGFRVQRTRVLAFRDGKKRHESTYDYYPPTVEIYRVPASFDPSLLPPLPEEADANGDATTAPPSTASSSPSAQPGEAKPPLEIVNAPGTHTPNPAQANPARVFSLSH